ncbi:tyrosine-protein phosphatase [Arsenicitalea aurantiaca]|uniref:tyrosine-protein phosphatase n=1 Tax=Arsenicitalea aurantiaca TaxID=1783274 RepID=UPI001863C86C|nr:CpsB/CapC family capsule biosynthesis tyrosine phosphatase [Arsenicitalea aurantiaca]
MIDLHCHLLPGIDDGSPDLETSLEMARMAVADGITHIACTPHVMPGVYDNTAADIARLTEDLALLLEEQNVPLTICIGADVHMAPDLPQKLADGQVPALNGSRYFLLEPPHHVAPPGLRALVKTLVGRGQVPIVTHPERLGWIESHYGLMAGLVTDGALIQLTAGSITGGFGRRARRLAERMLEDGLVDIVASDAHNVSGRPPILSWARDVLIDRLGEEAAMDMVLHRPAAILQDQPFERASRPKLLQSNSTTARPLAGLKDWIGNFRK